MHENENGKFTRCIICSNYSIQTQCYNIFNTTLQKGKILLSDFVKNVLSCSVLIVVSPEFFVCKRCFSLCCELDYSLARCNELQEALQYLFKKAKANDPMKQSSEDPEDPESEFPLKSEVPEADQEGFEEDPQEDVPYDPVPEDFQEDFHYPSQENDQEHLNYDSTSQHVNEETIEEIRGFLEGDVVESEVTIVETSPLDKEEGDAVSLGKENIGQETHSDGEDSSADESAEPNTWMCTTCNTRFDSEEFLKCHKELVQCKPVKKPKIRSQFEFQNFSVKLKKRKKVFFCNRCTFETPIAANMEKHVASHKSDPLYMCDICGRRFKYLRTFNNHQQVHDETRPYGCSLCPYRALTELKLRIHERQHDEQKKYTCAKCGYKTLKKMSYIIHCRTHTGERPYCCPNCPYKAKDPSTLLRHRRIHEGLKKYYCSECDYKALQKNSLKIHMMSHTGEKPHVCSHCDYSSSVKHNLVAHVAAVHSNIKPFACSQCSYTTKLKRLLTYHMRTHSDEKPFACKYCDYRSRHRGSLRYHMNKKHPVDEDGVRRVYVVNTAHIKHLRFDGENLVFSDAGSESEDDTNGEQIAFQITS